MEILRPRDRGLSLKVPFADDILEGLPTGFRPRDRGLSLKVADCPQRCGYHTCVSVPAIGDLSLKVFCFGLLRQHVFCCFRPRDRGLSLKVLPNTMVTTQQDVFGFRPRDRGLSLKA